MCNVQALTIKAGERCGRSCPCNTNINCHIAHETNNGRAITNEIGANMRKVMLRWQWNKPKRAGNSIQTARNSTVPSRFPCMTTIAEQQMLATKWPQSGHKGPQSDHKVATKHSLAFLSLSKGRRFLTLNTRRRRTWTLSQKRTSPTVPSRVGIEISRAWWLTKSNIFPEHGHTPAPQICYLYYSAHDEHSTVLLLLTSS